MADIVSYDEHIGFVTGLAYALATQSDPILTVHVPTDEMDNGYGNGINLLLFAASVKYLNRESTTLWWRTEPWAGGITFHLATTENDIPWDPGDDGKWAS